MKNIFQQAAATDEAEKALKEWGVAYEKNPDGTIRVPGSIDISNQQLEKLPDLSMVVIEGSFYCSRNRLTSLKGVPQHVGGTFLCEDNFLTSLAGAPQYVGENFRCGHNEITTLEGAPQHVGGLFHCGDNPLLVSLKGAPATAVEFNCNTCNLSTLEYAPETVQRLFACHRNPLVSLENAPRYFSVLRSDFGTYSSWHEVPDEIAPKTKPQRLEEILQDTPRLTRSISTVRPARFTKFKAPTS